MKNTETAVALFDEVLATEAPQKQGMNVALLRKVQKVILKEPKRVDMRVWVKPDSGVKCGTMGCIAGWSVILDQEQHLLGSGRQSNKAIRTVCTTLFHDSRDISEEAQKLLRISPEQADLLFHRMNWPKAFIDRILEVEESTPEYAQVVSDRIDYFIKTGK